MQVTSNENLEIIINKYRQRMTEEIKIYVYGSCHFLERLDNDADGNGGYGVVIR